MKIGEFTQKFGVTLDAVRYYIELGLLVPLKQGTHFHFDETCAEDLELILDLKKLQFTLQEIHHVLTLRRITHFVDVQEIDYYLKVLLEKKHELLLQKEKVTESLDLLENEIQSIHKQKRASTVTGVNLSFLPLFHCPKCELQLDITDAFIQGASVLTGELKCACGYEAIIKEGIVITPDISDFPQNQHYIYDHQMIEEITPGFISLLEKGNQWVYKRLLDLNISKKIILETNVDTYVFPPKLLQSLPVDARYIFCGNTMDMLKKLKRKMEHFNPDIEALYIVNSQLDLPIRRSSVDVVVDALSFNDYCLFNRELPLGTLKHYVHGETAIIGYTLFYPDRARSYKRMRELYPNSHPENMQKSFLYHHLEVGDFCLGGQQELGFTDNPGGYIDYHLEKERLSCMAYEAERGK